MSNTRDPIVHAVASLAAAISLLEKTPQARKGAPSNRMFNTMLDDYRKALQRARTVLAFTRADDSKVAFARFLTGLDRPVPSAADQIISGSQGEWAAWKAGAAYAAASLKNEIVRATAVRIPYHELPREDRVILNILDRVRFVLRVKVAHNLSGALEVAMVRVRKRADYDEREYNQARDRIYAFWGTKLGSFDNLFEYVGCSRPGTWVTLSCQEQAEVIRRTSICWIDHIADNIYMGEKREQSH